MASQQRRLSNKAVDENTTTVDQGAPPSGGKSDLYLSFSDTLGIGAIVVGLLCWAFVPTLAPRAIAMLLIIGGAVLLAYRSHYSRRISITQQHILATILGIGIAVLCCFQLHAQWIEERAAKTDGNFKPHMTNSGIAYLKVGDSAVILANELDNPQSTPIFRVGDTAFYIWQDKGFSHVSTTLRDEDGNQIVEIQDNHWRVSSADIWDKNYDGQGLEAKDKKGRIIFHIAFGSDCVVLEGRFIDGYGHEAEFISEGEGKGSNINIRKKRVDERQVPIRPMFQYPSKEKWTMRESSFTVNCQGGAPYPVKTPIVLGD
jgi:hypothetical protein